MDLHKTSENGQKKFAGSTIGRAPPAPTSKTLDGKPQLSSGNLFRRILLEGAWIRRDRLSHRRFRYFVIGTSH